MNSRRQTWLTGLALLLAAGCGEPAPPPAETADVPPLLRLTGLGGDFTLTDQHGESFRLYEQTSEAMLLFFGYTSCPDVCPATMSRLRIAYEKMRLEPGQLQTVFVTVDPWRDTPQRLGEYLGYFGIDAIGLSGTIPQIDEVVDLFKVHYRHGDMVDGEYPVDHSTSLFLLDAQREVRFLFDHTDPPATIAAVIQSLLQERIDPDIPGEPTVDASLYLASLQEACTCGGCAASDLPLDTGPEPLWYIIAPEPAKGATQ